MRTTKLLAVQAAIVVALLEVALRVYQPLPFRLRDDAIVLPVGLTYRFANPKNPKVDPVTIHTRNALGFRGPDAPADFASRLTIVAVGGSTTECFPISDGKTWPDVLAADLQRTHPGVWINNAGLDGHSTVGHLALLRGTLSRLKPKVMLVLAGINDVDVDTLRPEDEVSAAYPYFRPVWHRLASYSEVANTLLNLERARRARGMAFNHDAMDVATHRRLPMSEPDIDAAVNRLTKHVDRYGERLLVLAREARAAGIEPVFITQPSLAGYARDPTTGADLATITEHEDRNGLADWRALERYNSVMRQLAEQHGVLLIDLASALPKDSRYFYDLFHFGNEGAARVGHIVADTLTPYLRAGWPSNR